MLKIAAFLGFLVLTGCTAAFAQGPCAVQSSKIACVIPEEFGVTPNPRFGPADFGQILYPVGGHPGHFADDFNTSEAGPLTRDIGSQTNLLPLASPSSGILLTYDATLKTFVTSTDSLGPVLGERAETVGRHRIFVGFSYQFFDFSELDGVNLHGFGTVLTHLNDSFDDSPKSGPANNCSIDSSIGSSLNSCAFVRDRFEIQNSISLKENQYTAYLTFGLTRRIDVSAVIPIENVRMSVTSQARIVLGTNGMITPTMTSPDQTNFNQCTLPSGQQFLVKADCTANSAPYFFHLFKNCPDTSPLTGASGLAPQCLIHTFPDPVYAGGGGTPNGSSANNSASGIGDVLGRLKWNAWEGERAGFAAGLDVRFPSGDALNFLGSGAYGVKPFAVFSYRARVSPHVLVGYEWNFDSVAAGDLVTGTRGKIPNDFVYSVGADARVTKWLTGDFDIVGERVFNTATVSQGQDQFLANCGACAANPSNPTDTRPNLDVNPGVSYNITNASMGIKARPFPGVSKLVFTANVLVRLDSMGLKSKAAPLVGLGYTF